jgi:hypothetical protein
LRLAVFWFFLSITNNKYRLTKIAFLPAANETLTRQCFYIPALCPPAYRWRQPADHAVNSFIIHSSIVNIHLPALASQNLSNMHDLNVRPLPAQPPLNIHQTAHVATDNRVGTGSGWNSTLCFR